MKEYYGNYLGICINNQDPEFRGRVQIFIPHIMPALYEGWNQEGEDITIECVGNNLPNGLNSAIIEKLTKILPWSEGAMPIVGASVGGQYNPATGNFNQTAIPEAVGNTLDLNTAAGAFTLNGDPNAPGAIANNVKLTYYSSTQETNDSGTLAGLGNSNNRLQPGIVALSPNLQKQYGVKNGDVVSLTLNSGVKHFGYVGDTTSSRLTDRFDVYLPGGSDKQLASTPGSGSLGSLRLEAAAPRRLTGKELDTQGPALLAQVTGRSGKTGVDLNQPATAPTPGASIPTPAGWQFSDGGPYFKQQPDQSAITQVNAPTPVTTGSPANLAQKAQEAAFSSGTFGAGSTSNCGKIARGVDYNILQDKYFFKGTQGNSRGSANVSTPYWVESGYYKVETTIPDKIPFGSKVVFGVGQGDVKNNRTGAATNGHVTTVGDGGALFGSIAGESFAKYNNIRGDQKVTILTPTQKYRDRYKELYGTDLPEYASSNVTTGAGKVPIDDGGSDISTTIFDNPSPTQIIPTDTAGMPAGVFAIPGPGAMLWVFFREGDPLFPVYFAASYGRTEWQNAYQANSQPSDYGKVSVMRTGAADATISNSNLENPFTRQISFNGSYNEYDLYGQNQFVRGNKHDYTEGMHNWQGSGRQYLCIQDTTDCTLGDRKTIVGNPSQESVDQVNKIKEKIAQVNNKMLEGGNNDPSKSV